MNGDKKNELSSFKAFAGYEQLLQNYFENSNLFTVVPKIVFVDVDLYELNNFLMRDRPGEFYILSKEIFSWSLKFPSKF